MERYAKGDNGERINYRYTKETEEEYLERKLKEFKRDNEFIPKQEIEKLIRKQFTDLGFADTDKEAKSQINDVLLMRHIGKVVAGLVLILAVKMFWFSNVESYKNTNYPKQDQNKGGVDDK